VSVVRVSAVLRPVCLPLRVRPRVCPVPELRFVSRSRSGRSKTTMHQVWTETAHAHATPIAVNACSPSRRKVRADLPAPPLTANTRFPAAARPPTARPSATPRGRIRAPHEPLHGRSLSGLAPRASTRTPHVSLCHYLTAKGPLLAPLLEPKAATYDRYTSPSRGEVRFRLAAKRHSRKSFESMHETMWTLRARARDRTYSHSDLPESGNSYELLWSSTEVHMTPS